MISHCPLVVTCFMASLVVSVNAQSLPKLTKTGECTPRIPNECCQPQQTIYTTTFYSKSYNAVHKTRIYTDFIKQFELMEDLTLNIRLFRHNKNYIYSSRGVCIPVADEGKFETSRCIVPHSDGWICDGLYTYGNSGQLEGYKIPNDTDPSYLFLVKRSGNYCHPDREYKDDKNHGTSYTLESFNNVSSIDPNDSKNIEKHLKCNENNYK